MLRSEVGLTTLMRWCQINGANLWKVVYGLCRQQSRMDLADGTRYLTLRGIERVHVW